ncbi:MAG TPA: VIT1/CCC1 transporter family protein, partial [Candidatus Limnocylindria bacterium]|nr:VIT1/CCC1 transporter family protein [Candidatus Limnocylindria bacterium]
LVMGAAFGIGAAVPIIPYVVLGVDVATWASVVATAAVLFGIGVLKSRWTRRSWLRSGAEILVLGAVAGVAGFFFGNLLPGVLGVPPVGA